MIHQNLNSIVCVKLLTKNFSILNMENLVCDVIFLVNFPNSTSNEKVLLHNLSQERSQTLL